MPLDPNDLDRDLAAVSRIEAIPTILAVVCEMTGMRVAAVARVHDERWVACAVRDDLGLGFAPGSELPLAATLCLEARATRQPIVVADVDADPVYRDHPGPRAQGARSYITAPIVLPGGEYFGNLCAIDPAPAEVSAPRFRAMFERFAALIATQIDTERRLVAAETALATEQDAVALREEFTAILGHDLRNPLSAIVSWNDVVQACSDDPRIVRATGRIKVSAMRMAGLIDDTLDLARGRLGSGVSARLQVVNDLGRGLAGVVSELAQAHPQRELRSRIELRRPVRCDESRVHQLASNLLANAIAHGDQEGPVQLSAFEQGGSLVIEVWNAGRPIPPESLPLIFKPFWRSTNSGQRHGLGLGLYICDMIVKSHQGSLKVSSTRAEGTTFTARIPLD